MTAKLTPPRGADKALGIANRTALRKQVTRKAHASDSDFLDDSGCLLAKVPPYRTTSAARATQGRVSEKTVPKVVRPRLKGPDAKCVRLAEVLEAVRDAGSAKRRSLAKSLCHKLRELMLELRQLRCVAVSGSREAGEAFRLVNKFTLGVKHHRYARPENMAEFHGRAKLGRDAAHESLDLVLLAHGQKYPFFAVSGSELSRLGANSPKRRRLAPRGKPRLRRRGQGGGLGVGLFSRHHLDDAGRGRGVLILDVVRGSRRDRRSRPPHRLALHDGSNKSLLDRLERLLVLGYSLSHGPPRPPAIPRFPQPRPWLRRSWDECQ